MINRLLVCFTSNRYHVCRIVYTFLYYGNYLGKCYFTEEFTLDSISAYTNGGFPEGKPYGHYWQIDQYQDIEYYCACGFEGQKFCIIPSLDTTIVIIWRRFFDINGVIFNGLQSPEQWFVYKIRKGDII